MARKGKRWSEARRTDGGPRRTAAESRPPSPPLDLEASRAREERSRPGRETPGLVGRPTDGILVQVCLRCGKEYSFEREEPTPGLCCEKCGGRVFRSFFDIPGHDEAHEDFQTTTERDLAPDDAESDVTLGDILDLNNP